MKNKIQDYAWGSLTAMAELLGYQNEDKKPQAELWMGAHPKSPSEVIIGKDKKIGLDKYIEEDPEAVLGHNVSKRFDNKLPYLFKVLAIGSPLSIQSHPNLEQARIGFDRENRDGIALDDYKRNYKDDNHKPELVCALTEYNAMRGFRKIEYIVSDFRKILIPEITDSIQKMEKGHSKRELKVFFTELMNLNEDAKNDLIGKIKIECKKNSFTDVQQYWIRRFSELYPGDIGIASPLYLNIINLKPGEAMYLPAGELHAYLDGVGMELMANSDNVLRGGLTPKNVDVGELISTLGFDTAIPDIIHEEKISSSEYVYNSPAKEFVLSRIEIKNNTYKLSESREAAVMPSILICLEGEVEIEEETSTDSKIRLVNGETVFLDCSSRAVLSGHGIVYRASVPA